MPNLNVEFNDGEWKELEDWREAVANKLGVSALIWRDLLLREARKVRA